MAATWPRMKNYHLSVTHEGISSNSDSKQFYADLHSKMCAIANNNEEIDECESDKENSFESAFKNGWMMKRGAYYKGFKERYFELNGVLKTLTYYTKPIDNKGSKYKLRGFIDFKETPICKMMKSKKEEQFHIVTTKREWILRCKHKCERDEWYEAIKQFCAQG